MSTAAVPKLNASRAAAYIADRLGLPASAVTVGIGTPDRGRGATTDDLGNHTLAITITDPRVADNFSAIEKSTLEGLSKLDPFKELVQFESDAANVVHRRDQLEKFRLAGAEIPENFKEWKGFNPDLVESWGNIPKHAIDNIERDEKGIAYVIHVPQQSANADKLGGEIKADIEARKNDIMALLKKRAVKYLTKGLTEEQKKTREAEIGQQFAGLTLEIETSEPRVGEDFTSPGHVRVTIVSAKQRDAMKTKDKVFTEAEKAELKKGNPLTAPPSDPNAKEEYAIGGKELGKALGRSLLYEGEHGHAPAAIFPKIAGKEDMKTAITKKLLHFKEGHADMAKEVDDFLNDEAFKGDDWQKPKRLREDHKASPMVIKDAKDPKKADVMSVEFTLKAEKAQELLEKLAGAGTAQLSSKNIPSLDSIAAKLERAATVMENWALRMEGSMAKGASPGV